MFSVVILCSLLLRLPLLDLGNSNQLAAALDVLESFRLISRPPTRSRGRAAHNKSLDASGGSVFHMMIRPAMLD
jgi:hypothetical protein